MTSDASTPEPERQTHATGDINREWRARLVSRAALSGRLRWRVVVQTEGPLDPSRTTPPLAWHLIGCSEPARAEAHCPEGRRLLTAGGDPEGHCLVDGVCARCGAAPGALALDRGDA